MLFDIDGTLLRRAGPHHRLALVEGIRAVTGLETSTEGIPVHGMLDSDILTQMMQRAGVGTPRIVEAMPTIQEEAQRFYETVCPDLRAKRCLGVRKLLLHLRNHRIPCALVTGNLARIGWKKTDSAGLAEFFAFGSFAGTAQTRAALIREAIQTGHRRGLVQGATRIWHVGDAPQDVLAARANGIGCVAVHTGVSCGRELGKLRPTLLLPNLGRLRVDDLLATRVHRR